MIGEDFFFDNAWLSQYGMKMYSPEEAQSFVPREIIKSAQSSVRKEPNHYSTRYTDVLILYFLILKDDELCEKQSDFYLKEDELNALRSWLEGANNARELYLKGVNNQNNTYYYGVFTDVQPYLLNDECYGLKLTFTCNAPYGFSPIVTGAVSITDADAEYTISFLNQSSEKSDLFRPTISIVANTEFNGDEKISIQNKSTNNNSLTITLPSGKTTIDIDCKKKIITDENNKLIPLKDLGIAMSPVDGLLSTETTSIHWLGLVYGNNDIVITVANGENIEKIEISGRFPVKAGGF